MFDSSSFTKMKIDMSLNDLVGLSFELDFSLGLSPNSLVMSLQHVISHCFITVK